MRVGRRTADDAAAVVATRARQQTGRAVRLRRFGDPSVSRRTGGGKLALRHEAADAASIAVLRQGSRRSSPPKDARSNGALKIDLKAALVKIDDGFSLLLSPR